MRTGLVCMILLWSGIAAANIPAAFFACEGAEQGEPCSMPGPFFGNCVRDTLCVDNDETDIDECLLCVDPCWSDLPEGTYCVRFDGTDGICEAQQMCTPDPEKSFAQCNRCVEGQVAQVEPQSGCAALPGRWTGRGLTALAWLALLIVGIRQFRGPRAPRSA